MKQGIKNNELRERQTYDPASVEVIEFTAQEVLCGSNWDSPEQYDPQEW